MNKKSLQTQNDCARLPWLFSACIFVGALIPRLIAARSAYPACGDAQHFIEHGHIIAQGDWSGLSTYWSQGQQLVAALAFRMGAEPQRALQVVTIFSGAALVLGVFVLTLRLTNRFIAAGAAAVVVGLNPLLVNLSITGYSEMPCLAACIWGVVLLLRTSRPGAHFLSSSLAGLCFATAIAFRLVDAVILFAGTGLYMLLEAWGRTRRVVSMEQCWLGIATLVCAVCLLPLVIHSRIYSGELLPSSKVHTITLSLNEVYDSKLMYALEPTISEQQAYYGEHGIAAYLWMYRRQLADDFRSNLTQLVRIASSQMFPGAVRLGPISFMIVVFGIVLTALVHGERRAVTFSLLVLGLHATTIAVYFVFDRYVAATVTLLSICIGSGIWPSLRTQRLYLRVIAYLVCLAYIVVVGSGALNAFQNEFQWWHYKRAVDVAEGVSDYLGPDDSFMSYTLVIPQRIGIYDRSRYHGVPYASWQEITDFCREGGIRFLIASDAVRPHWPISDIVRDAGSIGESWVLRREWEFSGVPWVDPPERVVLLEMKLEAADQQRRATK